MPDDLSYERGRIPDGLVTDGHIPNGLVTGVRYKQPQQQGMQWWLDRQPKIRAHYHVFDKKENVIYTVLTPAKARIKSAEIRKNGGDPRITMAECHCTDPLPVHLFR